MSRYASGTSVPSDRSRSEIERTLVRYGAEAFSYGWESTRAVIMFRAHGRHIRFDLPMPDRDEHRLTPQTRVRRSDSAAEQAYEQAVRQRWRALALVVKAKLEAVEAGIVTFEEEFAAHVVLPNGQTVGEWLTPQIAAAYDTGEMPSVVPGAQRAIGAGS